MNWNFLLTEMKKNWAKINLRTLLDSLACGTMLNVLNMYKKISVEKNANTE